MFWLQYIKYTSFLFWPFWMQWSDILPRSYKSDPHGCSVNRSGYIFGIFVKHFNFPMTWQYSKAAWKYFVSYSICYNCVILDLWNYLTFHLLIWYAKFFFLPKICIFVGSEAIFNFFYEVWSKTTIETTQSFQVRILNSTDKTHKKLSVEVNSEF